MKRLIHVVSAVSLVLTLIGLPATKALARGPLAKVGYQQYDGQQKDWPRSAEKVNPTRTKYGVPIYEQLPDRPYIILGFVHDDGDMALKHVSEAAQMLGARGILVVSHQAFKEAGIPIEPELKRLAPATADKTDYLDKGDSIKSSAGVKKDESKPEAPTELNRVHQISGILIRWK